MNIRETILNSNDIKKEVITVEEWGNVKIEIRTMSGLERANMLKSSVNKDGTTDLVKLYPEVIIASVYDPDTGLKVFTKEDRDIINSKSSACIEKVAKVALKLNGLDEDTHEEIEKN
jgi:hypothetical protein